MRLPRSRPALLTLGAAAVVAVGLIAWRTVGAAKTEADPLVVQVKEGEFKVTITTTGELRAELLAVLTPAQRDARCWIR